MADELERLTIKIDADASGTTSGAAKAAAAMKKVGEAADKAAEKSKKAIDKMGQATQKVAYVTQRANAEMKDVASAAGKAMDATGAGIGKTEKAMAKAEAETAKVSKAVKSASAETKRAMDVTSKAMEKAMPSAARAASAMQKANATAQKVVESLQSKGAGDNGSRAENGNSASENANNALAEVEKTAAKTSTAVKKAMSDAEIEMESVSRIMDAISGKMQVLSTRMERLDAAISARRHKNEARGNASGDDDKLLEMEQKRADMELEYANLGAQSDKQAEKYRKAEAAAEKTMPDSAKSALTEAEAAAQKTAKAVKNAMDTTADNAKKAMSEVKTAAEETADAVGRVVNATREATNRANTTGMSNGAQGAQETANELGNVETGAEGAREAVRQLGDETERTGRRGTSMLGRLGRSLQHMLLIRPITSMFGGFVSWIGKAVMADKQVSASLAQVRQNLLTAFAPIYSVVVPLIQGLVNWLVILSNALANIVNTIAGFFGYTAADSKQTVSALNGIGGAAGGAGKQVKELLADFDELNKLGSGGSSGGGGGGGTGGTGGIPGLNFKKQDEEEKETGLTWPNVLSTMAKAVGGFGIVRKLLGGGSAMTGPALAITAIIDYVVQTVTNWKSEWWSDIYKQTIGVINDPDRKLWEKAFAGADFTLRTTAANLIGIVSGLWGMTGAETMNYLETDFHEASREMSKKLMDIGTENIEATLADPKLNWFQRLMRTWVNTQMVNDGAMVGFRVGLEDKRNEILTGTGSSLRVQGERIQKTLQEAFPAGMLQKAYDKALDVDVSKATKSVDDVAKTMQNLLIKAGETIRAGIKGMEDKIKNESKKESKKKTTEKSWLIIDGSAGYTKNGDSSPAASKLSDTLKNNVLKILGYASGGMNIDSGQLFVANENGAEMIGTIGGKTAVANQQEISGAIWREMQQYKSGGNVNADDLGRAVASALNGAAVQMDGERVGRIVVRNINKNTRSAGRVDFAF